MARTLSDFQYGNGHFRQWSSHPWGLNVCRVATSGAPHGPAQVSGDIQYKGWKIEAHSYKTDGAQWRPYAVAIAYVGCSTRQHHVSAPPDIAGDTEQDANAYAVVIARKWIDDQEDRVF